jgi:hypothetical protein
VLALSKKLANVNKEFADVKARKQMLEGLILEFSGK